MDRHDEEEALDFLRKAAGIFEAYQKTEFQCHRNTPSGHIQWTHPDADGNDFGCGGLRSGRPRDALLMLRYVR